MGAYKKCLNNYKFQIFFVRIVLCIVNKKFLENFQKILIFLFWAIFGLDVLMYVFVCNPCKTLQY